MMEEQHQNRMFGKINGLSHLAGCFLFCCIINVIQHIETYILLFDFAQLKYI